MINREKARQLGRMGEYTLEMQLTHEPLGFELFDQIADRFRTLWPIVSAMQTRDSLLRRSHCAFAISVSSSIVVINEWIRDLEF